MDCAVGASVCVCANIEFDFSLRHSGTIHDLLSAPQQPSLVNHSQLAELGSLHGCAFVAKSVAQCGEKLK